MLGKQTKNTMSKHVLHTNVKTRQAQTATNNRPIKTRTNKRKAMIQKKLGTLIRMQFCWQHSSDAVSLV